MNAPSLYVTLRNALVANRYAWKDACRLARNMARRRDPWAAYAARVAP